MKYIDGVEERMISDSFFGNLLSLNFRLNFPEGTFLSPTKFTCSDIFGEVIYWEYQCKEGFQAKNNWIVRGDYLLFCINKKGYFAGQFIKMNIKSGAIKWLVDVPYTDMLYDETQGIFVSFLGGQQQWQ